MGALLETIAIAATGEGLSATFHRREDAPDEKPLIEVALTAQPGLEPDPLLPYIRVRSTQRRPFSTDPLTRDQKQRLEQVVGEGYTVVWLEGWENRWRMARLLFRSARIRLTIPEAYQVHRRIIEWDAQFSIDRIPDQAIGLDPVGLKLMKWAMQSWNRVKMLNRYFAGTWLPRIQLDLVPGLRCAAHFAILSERPLKETDDYIIGGRAVQRFWLTATRLGLQFQPEMTPLIFSRYVSVSENFTHEAGAVEEAKGLVEGLREVLGGEIAGKGVFLGRLGMGRLTVARSVRRALGELIDPGTG